jgi:serine/threonine protein kinase
MHAGQQTDTFGTLHLGTRLASGSYSIGKMLGRGGFGITYLGADNRLSRPIALKEFFPAGATRNGTIVVRPPTLRPADYEAAIRRFLDEARILARFRHPSIVAVHDMFQENSTAYMVMEFLKGETLGQRLEQSGEPIPEKELIAITELVVDALDRMHEAGILHRDIKPDNIVLAQIGGVQRPVLIDFGAARDFVQGATVRHSVVLTPGYAPLEQYGEAHRRGAFSDIYALAATLYHLATGVQPLPATDIAAGIKLERPRALNSKLSPAFDRAIMHALETKPERRPQSGRAFFEELTGKSGRPSQPRSSRTMQEPAQAAPRAVKTQAASLPRLEELARRLKPLRNVAPDKIGCPVCRAATMIDPARSTGKIRCPICRAAGLQPRILEPDRCPACRKANLQRVTTDALLRCPACVTGQIFSYTRRRTLRLTREVRARCDRCAAEFDYQVARDTLTLLALPSGSERLSTTFIGKTKPRAEWSILSGRSMETYQCGACHAEFDQYADGRRLWVSVGHELNRVPAEHRREARDPTAWARIANGLLPEQGTHHCPACEAEFEATGNANLRLLAAPHDPYGVGVAEANHSHPSSFWRAVALGKRDPAAPGLICPACTSELAECEDGQLRLAAYDPAYDPHGVGQRFEKQCLPRSEWARLGMGAPLERDEHGLRTEAKRELWAALLAGEYGLPSAGQSFPLAPMNGETILISCGCSHLRQKQGSFYEYDAGRLWITSRRLLFHGPRWNLNLPLSKISACTLEKPGWLQEPLVAIGRWDRANPIYVRPVSGSINATLFDLSVELCWDGEHMVEMIDHLRSRA